MSVCVRVLPVPCAADHNEKTAYLTDIKVGLVLAYKLLLIPSPHFPILYPHICLHRPPSNTMKTILMKLDTIVETAEQMTKWTKSMHTAFITILVHCRLCF